MVKTSSSGIIILTAIHVNQVNAAAALPRLFPQGQKSIRWHISFILCDSWQAALKGRRSPQPKKQERGMAAGGRTRNLRSRLHNLSDPGRPIMFLPRLSYERTRVADQFPLGQRENIIVSRQGLSSSNFKVEADRALKVSVVASETWKSRHTY